MLTGPRIKRAYRRKALELHPDRNYGNVEETTKLFAEIQSAYEVLSDPQERAWYDSHRSAILQGEGEDTKEQYEHNVRVTTSEDILAVFAKFNGRIDFSDSSSGFFNMLRNLFDKLAEEEALACDWEGLEPIDYPSFGHAHDNYEAVVRPFYAAWNSFATKKTFSWKDVYRYSDAPDRRVRRMMEKENKRFRDDGVREFNENVRTLVQFVRKRDPRYVPNTQSEAERQKIIRDAATAQAARAREANRAKAAQQGPIPSWIQNEGPTQEESSEEEEEEPEEHLECVVCRKTFKSENQFEAHERSKKHLKAVQQVQRQMRNESEALNLDKGYTSSLSDAASPHTQSPKDMGNLPAREYGPPDDRDTPDGLEHQMLRANDVDASSAAASKAPMPEETFLVSASDVASTSPTDDDYAPREQVEKRIVEDVRVPNTEFGTPQSTIDVLSQKLANGAISENAPGISIQPKVGKAKAKRAKKAAQRNGSPSAEEYKCAACDASFPSKTRLFNHIKDFGHAQPVSKANRSGKGKKR